MGVARGSRSLAHRRCTRDAGLSRLRPQSPVAWFDASLPIRVPQGGPGFLSRRAGRPPGLV